MVTKFNWSWGLKIIIILGVLARLINFGINPISLNRDEAALGYNAYTIAEYGTDEWGNRMPWLFISFGDYKLPGYIYFLAPLIRIFGIHDWVIRLPSLLAGISILMAVYLWIKQWYGKTLPALLATALIASAPFAIFYSRMAYEANLGLMWLLWTGYLISLPFKAKRLPFIFLTYSLAVFTYNTPLLLAPLVLGYSYWRHRHQPRAYLSTMLIIGITAGISLRLLSPLTAQKQQITIFSDPTLQTKWREEYVEKSGFLAQKWASLPAQTTRYIGSQFIASMTPEFMVLKGGSHPWHGIGNIGVISLTHYLLFIAGLIIGKRRIRERGLILLSLFFSLLPAVVTVDSPHVTRSLLFLVLTALVATQKISSWKKILPMVVLGILIELLVFSYRYLYLFPTQMHPSWPKGLEAAINQANQKKQPGQLVEITNQRDLRSDVLADQAYIYVALYSQSKPTLKWTEQLKDSAGMVRVSSLNDYRFVNQGSPTDPNSIRIERSADGWYQLKEE